jgi:hypothetical protein
VNAVFRKGSSERASTSGRALVVGALSKRVQALCLSVNILLSGTSIATACAFDMVKPERTVIDWIVETEQLVLARPSADNAFIFEIVDVLVGDEITKPIDALVDTVTRRKLTSNPEDAILFAKKETGAWQRVAYVNEPFSELLQTALNNRVDWRGSIPKSRLAFIDSLQDSPTSGDRAILIGELDKVPYDQLRQMDLRIPTTELLDNLWTRSGYPYQAIRALLLGLSGDPAAREAIAGYVERVEGWERAENLGAFAAALIEMDGVDAVDTLNTRMLKDPSQTLAKVEQIVMALSVQHGVAAPEVRNAISVAIRDLVEARPETAVVVARQFTLRSDWSQTAVLEPLVRDRRFGSLGDLLTVSVYLASAREQAGTAGDVEQ